MKEYLNVSEIGKMFGIGVQTLHYYDKIGILHPNYRDPRTGYRKYKFDQVYQLASVRYMRKLGYSIEDVKNFQDTRHPEETIRLLRERSVALQKQWEELMRIDKAIMRKIQFIEDCIADMDVNALEIREYPERRYIPIGAEEELYMEDSFYFYPTIAFYGKDVKYFGALINTGVDEMVDNRVPLQTIPAGKYLIGYHQGPYVKMRERIEEMRAARPEYEYSSLVTSFNVIDQFVEQDSEKYITQIQLRIISGDESEL